MIETRLLTSLKKYSRKANLTENTDPQENRKNTTTTPQQQVFLTSEFRRIWDVSDLRQLQQAFLTSQLGGSEYETTQTSISRIFQECEDEDQSAHMPYTRASRMYVQDAGASRMYVQDAGAWGGSTIVQQVIESYYKDTKMESVRGRSIAVSERDATGGRRQATAGKRGSFSGETEIAEELQRGPESSEFHKEVSREMRGMRISHENEVVC